MSRCLVWRDAPVWRHPARFPKAARPVHIDRRRCVHRDIKAFATATVQQAAHDAEDGASERTGRFAQTSLVCLHEAHTTKRLDDTNSQRPVWAQDYLR